MVSPPATADLIHALMNSLHDWADSVVELAALEGKQVGRALALRLGIVLGALVIFTVGWLALAGCLVTALALNNILDWTWALLLVGLLHLVGAGGLVFLAVKRRGSPPFEATRHHLGLKSVTSPRHG